MKHSKRSYHLAAFSIILLVVFLTLSVINRDGSTMLDDIVGYLITLFFVTVLAGFVFAMLSLREPSSRVKTIGLAVNVILFVLLAVNVLLNLQRVTAAFAT
ncbi:hypothetical protein [Nonlabens ponticola]|uniref:Uncharacterized protein n=1 Tax=Nonlabens ponticola TaxID=2496866 RepID=A0A3S9N044_9FLAO|nr:hypothetical protein [Nonlabens ponticola]AZQ44915.1 hypothetical protein EJ995_12025 [Nonlabens ponticola]